MKSVPGSYLGTGYLFVWPKKSLYGPSRGMRHLVMGMDKRTLCGRDPDGWGFEIPVVAALEPDVGCSVCRRAAKRRAARAA